MKGFLSKFLRNNKGDQKPTVQLRQEPTLTAGRRNPIPEITEDLHPDETFIDYDVSNDVGQLNGPTRDSERVSGTQAQSSSKTFPSEHDHFDEVFQDDIEPDISLSQSDIEHDPFEPLQGFNPVWVQSAQENKIIKSLSIKTTLDSNGNTFIHYAAAFSKSHLLKLLIEGGWPLEKQNYHGKTPYDFAAHYQNTINTYFIENILKALNKSSVGEDKDLLSPKDNPEHSEVFVEHNKKVRLDNLPNKNWVNLVETSKCPKEFWGHRYDVGTTDENGDTLLHYAAMIGNKSYTLHLLGLGWGILQKNHDGLTPLDLAEIEGHGDLVDTLKRLYSSFLAEHADNGVNVETSLTDEDLLAPKYEDAHDTISNPEIPSGESPPEEPSEVFAEILEIEQSVHNIEFIQTNNQEEETPSTPACIKCGASFADFNTAIRLWFCPFCGAEQPDDEAPKADKDSQSENNIEDTEFFENTADDYQVDLLKEVFREEDAYTSTEELLSTERVSEENKEPQHSKSVSISFSEEPFIGVDEGFDDEIIDIDLQSYRPSSRGRNSSDENYESLGDWKEARSENAQTEEWEIFLDEDLEEQSHPSDQYFEDEDPLEQGKIVEYASRLTSRITSYQSKDRRRIYAFFISMLGDFPFYQSYAAIERLIAKDVQIDQIRDAYAVKLLWMTNPNIWSSRRYNRMENSWSVSRSPKLKNSMSWQLAADLVTALTPNELENLILNDWYTEWLNLPLHGGDTASGLDPAYSLYPTYLYEKRRLLMTNVNNW